MSCSMVSLQAFVRSYYKADLGFLACHISPLLLTSEEMLARFAMLGVKSVDTAQ
jgi:hypothetical protein